MLPVPPDHTHAHLYEPYLKLCSYIEIKHKIMLRTAEYVSMNFPSSAIGTPAEHAC